MKKMATVAVIFGLALTLGALGWAQGEKKAGKQGAKGQQGPGVMQQADANKDGKVTFEELKAVRPKLTEERFKQMDKNGDGVLDKADRAQGEAGHHGEAGFEAMLKKNDANKDGKVTLEELKATHPKMTEERFKQMDKNGDGVLTAADAPKPGAKPAAQAEKKPETKGETKAETKSEAKKDGKAEAKQGGKNEARKGGKMKEADANNDGKVTFEELKAVSPGLTQEKFNKMDKNGDGVITPADHKKES